MLSRKLALPFLYHPDDAAIQFPMKAKGLNLSRKNFIKSAQKRNMLVQYWTINSKENMKKLIKFGVDGIMTDRPDLLMKVYKEMGIE